jgi:hypothetical protein
MIEEKPLITSELSVTFAPDGTIGSGGGLHICLHIPGTPTVETIHTLIDRVREAAINSEDAPVVHAEQVEEERCPRKGVQVTRKGGKYPPGHYPNWRHNDPRERDNGSLYCPTVVGLDKDGEPIWCDWQG